MSFALIRIQNFRNISFAEISPSDGINYFVGENGSGKTSVLEAVYSLVRGRSFRTRFLKSMIMQGPLKQSFVYANWLGSDGLIQKLGVERNLNGSRIRLNGLDVSRLSFVSSLIPLQLLTAHSFNIFSAGPTSRRKFFDWGLFHVEQQFLPNWGIYLRLVQQRNAALKSGDRKTIFAYQPSLVDQAVRIDIQRKSYLHSLSTSLSILCKELSIFPSLTIKYFPGWSGQISYERALEQRLSTDINRGYTSVGPHYFDIRFQIGDYQAEQILSNGELKLLVHLLKMAQIYHLRSYSNLKSVYIIDDLYAELSTPFRHHARDILNTTPCQVLITSPDIKLIPDLYGDAMFHVEQGNVY